MNGIKIWELKKDGFVKCFSSGFYLNLKECKTCPYHEKEYPHNSIRCSFIRRFPE